MSESGKEIIQNKLLELSDKLQNYTGKKVYGYLPKNLKALVNSVAAEIAKEPAIQEAYNQFLDAREKQLLIYHSKDTLPPREDILENKKFKKIKNLIIKEAAALQRSIDISIPATVPVADEKSNFAPAAKPPNSPSSETSDVSLDTSDEANKIYASKDSFSFDNKTNQTAINNQASLSAVSLFKNALRMFGVGNHNEGHTPKFKLTKADYLEKLKRGEKMSYDSN